jgi:CHAD domain-containing protein
VFIAPVTLVSQPLSLLLQHLANVREGHDEAVHQARVEIRRAREGLAVLAAAGYGARFERVEKPLRRTGRVLSRLRDAAVIARLIRDLESRFPGAAATTAPLRMGALSEASRVRRKVVKALERLPLDEIEAVAAAAPPFFSGLRTGTRLRAALRDHIRERATALQEAVAHAAGIHFSRRLHATRLAAKRLRYSLELADRAGVDRPAGARRTLKELQTTLGDLHDRDVLLERLQDDTAMATVTAADLSPLRHFVEAEADHLHARYLEQRPALIAVCDACRSVSRPVVTRQALAASALALPSLLLLLQRRRRAEAPPTRKPASDREAAAAAPVSVGPVAH